METKLLTTLIIENVIQSIDNVTSRLYLLIISIFTPFSRNLQVGACIDLCKKLRSVVISSKS
ncbi:protein of unknown function [Candidatus Nitrosocosmicus franklandus]|uniref:Uncharacterized protein n=1 Tax=Candidatus Nitrosocosmicus franklandianus TaxID=1798806 RepID=A0A484I4W5_9ARCH|nr:protein of unknown function [Candidatus Nitrosocosmicus franklandus]